MTGGGIGAMRAIRDNDFGFVSVAFGLVVSSNYLDSGKFTLRTGNGLQSHFCHAGDLCQIFLQFIQQFQSTLQSALMLIGMDVCKAAVARQTFVYLGIVLHGAATQRIQSFFDEVVLLRKLYVMAHHVQFAQLRQAGCFCPVKFGGNQAVQGCINLARWQAHALAPGG